MLPVGQIWGKKCRRHQVMPVAAAAAYVQHGSSSVAGGRLIDWADTELGSDAGALRTHVKSSEKSSIGQTLLRRRHLTRHQYSQLNSAN